MIKILTFLVMLLCIIPASEAQQSDTSGQRTYKGGRDDTDLTVQPKKKVTKRAEDIELENFESESTEVIAPSNEGAVRE